MKLTYEVKSEILEEVKTDKIDMFGNNYIQHKVVDIEWKTITRECSEELYQYILKEEKSGNVRNVKGI